MKTIKSRLMLAVAALALGAALLPAPTQAQPRRNSAATLDPAAREALITALAGPKGEYAARAEYQAILDEFGPARPYANILKSEEAHIAALQNQCAKFGVPIPPDPWLGKVPAPASLAEAAAIGITAEEENVAMYDQMLAAVKNYPSLVQVFTNLRTASLDHHLPAFEAALENGGTCPNVSSPACGACPGRKSGGSPGQPGARGNGGTCPAQ